LLQKLRTSNRNGSRDFKTLVALKGSNLVYVAVSYAVVVAAAVFVVLKLEKNHFFRTLILS